jgi:hypothetical protein
MNAYKQLAHFCLPVLFIVSLCTSVLVFDEHISPDLNRIVLFTH